jgi:hypothetical protein
MSMHDLQNATIESLVPDGNVTDKMKRTVQAFREYYRAHVLLTC